VRLLLFLFCLDLFLYSIQSSLSPTNCTFTPAFFFTFWTPVYSFFVSLHQPSLFFPYYFNSELVVSWLMASAVPLCHYFISLQETSETSYTVWLLFSLLMRVIFDMFIPTTSAQQRKLRFTSK
jgi:hypothetical protein